MKIINNLSALFKMLVYCRFFNPSEILKNKRVAIVGAANSTMDYPNGDYLDTFDIVIRINKSPHSWKKSNQNHLGSKFDLLFHSFYENEVSGGGKIDWKLYKDLGIEKVINPNCNIKGFETHFNYYKRNTSFKRTYIMNRKAFKNNVKDLEGNIPTIGFSALASVLNSQCSEIFITGFTFFKTPYIENYRPQLENIEVNEEHIKKQGIHDPEIEYVAFKKALSTTSCKNVNFDSKLQKLLDQDN